MHAVVIEAVPSFPAPMGEALENKFGFSFSTFVLAGNVMRFQRDAAINARQRRNSSGFDRCDTSPVSVKMRADNFEFVERALQRCAGIGFASLLSRYDYRLFARTRKSPRLISAANASPPSENERGIAAFSTQTTPAPDHARHCIARVGPLRCVKFLP